MIPSGEMPHVGRRLYDAGFKQGAILLSSGLKFVYSMPTRDGEGIKVKERSVKNDERLVVASQDCDILATPDREPYVELLICKQEEKEFYQGIIEGNSSRRFLLDKVLDEDKRFVAQAIQRIHIKKEALEQLELEDWSLNGEMLERFARWLARRYVRPAFPNDFVAVYKDRVKEVFDSTDPEVISAFSSVVSDIRISKSSTEGPPYDLVFLLLTIREEEELSEEEADAIVYFQDRIESTLVESSEVNSAQCYFRSIYETTVAEYFNSDPIYLEHLTFDGEEGDEQPRGAGPTPLA